MNLPQLPQDKANHFIYGQLIFLVVAVVFGSFLGILATAVAAVGKEVYDKVSKTGTKDWNDALATLAGGGVGLLISMLV